jgi:hypothetical protein
MRETFMRSILAACCLAAWLTGCSAGPLGESLPQSMGGLPADTPPPPKVPYKFPAVHDMPPPRATQPLSDEQQWNLEQDLKALRNRQERAADEKAGQAGATKAKAKSGKKTAAKRVKKKPAAPDGKMTGANSNP